VLFRSLRMRSSCHHPHSTKKVCPLFLSSIDASNPETTTGGDRTSGSESKESIINDNELKQPLLTSSSSEELFRLAPPLTFEKFLTMQDKRVVVTICYSGGSGLRPYFLSAAKRIKAAFPDVVIERRILPSVVNGNEDTAASVFQILVDGKEAIGKVRSNRNIKFASSAKSLFANKKIVYVSMEHLGFAISRARRRRRPNTSYIGDGDASSSTTRPKKKAQSNNRSAIGKSNAAAVRLDVLRKVKHEKAQHGSNHHRH